MLVETIDDGDETRKGAAFDLIEHSASSIFSQGSFGFLHFHSPISPLSFSQSHFFISPYELDLICNPCDEDSSLWLAELTSGMDHLQDQLLNTFFQPFLMTFLDY